MPCAESSNLGIRAGVLRTVLKSDGDSSCLQGLLSTSHFDLTDLTSPNSPHHVSQPVYRLGTVVIHVLSVDCAELPLYSQRCLCHQATEAFERQCPTQYETFLL